MSLCLVVHLLRVLLYQHSALSCVTACSFCTCSCCGFTATIINEDYYYYSFFIIYFPSTRTSDFALCAERWTGRFGVLSKAAVYGTPVLIYREQLFEQIQWCARVCRMNDRNMEVCNGSLYETGAPASGQSFRTDYNNTVYNKNRTNIAVSNNSNADKSKPI